jgi:hypothetical protein
MRRAVLELTVQMPKSRDFSALSISLLGAAFFATLVVQGLDLGVALLGAAAFWTVIGFVFGDAQDPQGRRRKRREWFASSR